VQVETHLSKTNAAFAEGLLDAMQYYLELYQPLIGPYPYKRMVAVENFFSSGFAFPQFTLLGPAVIAMGQRGLRPGYLDHEMVHNWWGNGVLVDPADGNWCEALTSYCTNYYRYVLEGQPDQARKHRRDIVHHLSRTPPAKDLPLGDFGKEDGPSRSIGYSKGTMVFHMLAQQIGQEAFWQAMRQFRQGFLGRYANWADIQHLCEQASGQDLEVFFEQWVRRGGTPDLRIVSATVTNDGHGLLVVCEQSEPAYRLSVPIRLHYPGERLNDMVAELQEPHEQVVLECPEVPEAVELDPDYQVYRRLSAEQIMPTISGLNAGDRLTIIMPSDHAEGYQIVVEQFEQDDNPDRIQVVPADDLTEGAIATGNVLALGRAVWCPAVQALLTEADCPVEWMETGFALNGQTYGAPRDAILCCVRHPRDVGRVVAVYTSPDGSAPSNARLISFYGGNSIIVFQEGRPTVRVDLETPLLVPVKPSETPPE
jgi:aminopeptidase N